MSDVAIIILLFGAGVVTLFAELLLPSHGLLTLVAVACLVGGVVLMFQTYGQTAGLIALLLCLVGLPAFGATAIRLWPRTWLGRRIAPPNPVLTEADTPVPVAELNGLVGRTGRTMSPLRPVGVCEFDGRRISCVAEHGMIEAGIMVEGVGVTGANLTVSEKKA